MYYIIKDKLLKSDKNEVLNNTFPYVVIFNTNQYLQEKDNFNVNYDIEEESDIFFTKADVNYNYLNGSFSIPNHDNPELNDYVFLFIINDSGIIFIDDSNYVENAIKYIIETKKWHKPSLGRFIYDLLDYMIKDDIRIMEKYEVELEKMEDEIEEQANTDFVKLNKIRSDIRRLFTHYEELIDLSQELYENENHFFKNEELDYFKSYLSRLERLSNTTTYLRDYVIQIHDSHREQTSIKQNNITTLLTVITTIFAPLTLITGWYGMNFRYMPELNMMYAYPAVFVVSLLIAVLLLYYFKKKKWL